MNKELTVEQKIQELEKAFEEQSKRQRLVEEAYRTKFLHLQNQIFELEKEIKAKPTIQFFSEHTPQLDQYATALAQASAELESAERDGKGNYKPFSTEEAMRKAGDPILSKYGLSFKTAIVTDSTHTLYHESMLIHASGQYKISRMKVELDMSNKNLEQKIIAFTTYANRNQYRCMVGLTSEG
jgi:hypothetical protein